ncbi:LCP family protein, partial [Patescibacteria group bacterium]|nr:LCP family protein [Patescibacteria group bacterium]
MDFRKHKIKNIHHSVTISIPIVIALIIVISLLFGIVKACMSINISAILTLAGSDLEEDAYGHTNFLLLGTGGENHDGGNLTDTIIVSSLDHENNIVTMLSIPRDLYVKDSLVGSSRINEVFVNAKNQYESSTKGIEHLKEKVEEIVGMPIHYWAKVDFQGFKDLIDAIGGIEIYVKEDLYDPYYPKDGTYEFAPFSIKKGLHEMDGEMTLKYVRSRKTTSDFDRADRQQQVLNAIKEQALKEVIFSKSKIESILSALKNNIETNIKVKEILTLGSFASELSAENISHRLIHDDPTQCGGFLYTPERQYYQGMFVLIPAAVPNSTKGEEFLHYYSDLNFNLPEIAQEASTLHILNGTPAAGTAGEIKQILNRFCFDVERFGNARNQEIS